MRVKIAPFWYGITQALLYVAPFWVAVIAIVAWAIWS